MTLHLGRVTEQRIDRIMGIMRAWKWVRGETAGVLAKEWGLEESTVFGLSSEASRRIRAEVTDPGRVSEKVGMALERVLDESMADGDRKHVIESAKVWALISGASAPQKIDISASSEATPQRAAELMRRTFGAMTPDAKSPDAAADGSGEQAEGAVGAPARAPGH